MGTAKDFVSSILADKLTPFMRRSVEDIIYETLDRRQTPSRKDFHELRDQINTLKGKITNTAGGIGKLKEMIENVEDSLANSQSNTAVVEPQASESDDQLKALSEQVLALKATVSVLNDKISHQNGIIEAQAEELRTQLAKQDSRLDELESTPAAAENALGQSQQSCKVNDCEETVRARGFCRAHYAKWSRGTLEGFVNKDGLAEGVQLDDAHISMPYTLLDGQILVNDEAVGSLS